MSKEICRLEEGHNLFPLEFNDYYKLLYAFSNHALKGKGQFNALNLTVFVICACAVLSHNDVALINSYSSEAPKS